MIRIMSSRLLLVATLLHAALRSINRKFSFLFILFACIGSVQQSNAGIVTISAMNADVSADLEGTLGGSATDGGSAFDIDVNPSMSATSSTSADYTVTGVDVDGNATFTESFSFRITFSSADGNGINFSSTLETMGVDGESSDNEDFNPGESFAMTYSILSDSSPTHDVVFDGMSEVDFVSLTGADVDVTSSSGDTTITLLGGSTSLGGLRLDPTFTLDIGAGDFGTFEDWSIQFSAVAIPEPSSIALMTPVFALGCIVRRSRKRRR